MTSLGTPTASLGAPLVLAAAGAATGGGGGSGGANGGAKLGCNGDGTIENGISLF
jgi:hypothetical protein